MYPKTFLPVLVGHGQYESPITQIDSHVRFAQRMLTQSACSALREIKPVTHIPDWIGQNKSELAMYRKYGCGSKVGIQNEPAVPWWFNVDPDSLVSLSNHQKGVPPKIQNRLDLWEDWTHVEACPEKRVAAHRVGTATKAWG